MPIPVRYYCPHCETVVTLQRSAYLDDKSVTPYPLEGWSYTEVGGEYEDADGVRIVCGEGEAEGDCCGEPYYLNFVRFEDGEEVEHNPEGERIRLSRDGPSSPQSPGSPGIE
jgi:hypothetical protein